MTIDFSSLNLWENITLDPITAALGHRTQDEKGATLTKPLLDDLTKELMELTRGNRNGTLTPILPDKPVQPVYIFSRGGHSVTVSRSLHFQGTGFNPTALAYIPEKKVTFRPMSTDVIVEMSDPISKNTLKIIQSPGLTSVALDLANELYLQLMTPLSLPPFPQSLRFSDLLDHSTNYSGQLLQLLQGAISMIAHTEKHVSTIFQNPDEPIDLTGTPQDQHIKLLQARHVALQDQAVKEMRRDKFNLSLPDKRASAVTRHRFFNPPTPRTSQPLAARELARF